jgi:hypothetical protein
VIEERLLLQLMRTHAPLSAVPSSAKLSEGGEPMDVDGCEPLPAVPEVTAVVPRPEPAAGTAKGAVVDDLDRAFQPWSGCAVCWQVCLLARPLCFRALFTPGSGGCTLH